MKNIKKLKTDKEGSRPSNDEPRSDLNREEVIAFLLDKFMKQRAEDNDQ